MKFFKLFDSMTGRYVTKQWAMSKLEFTEQRYEHEMSNASPYAVVTIATDDGVEIAALTGRLRVFGLDRDTLFYLGAAGIFVGLDLIMSCKYAANEMWLGILNLIIIGAWMMLAHRKEAMVVHGSHVKWMAIFPPFRLFLAFIVTGILFTFIFGALALLINLVSGGPLLLCHQ